MDVCATKQNSLSIRCHRNRANVTVGSAACSKLSGSVRRILNRRNGGAIFPKRYGEAVSRVLYITPNARDSYGLVLSVLLFGQTNALVLLIVYSCVFFAKSSVAILLFFFSTRVGSTVAYNVLFTVKVVCSGCYECDFFHFITTRLLFAISKWRISNRGEFL